MNDNVDPGAATANPAATLGQKIPPIRRRPSPEATVDVILTVLLLVLFAGAYLEASEWSFRASLFPRIATGSALLLTTLHLVQALFQLRRSVTGTAKAAPAVPPNFSDESDDDEGDVEHIFQTAGARRWAFALAWLATFFILLYLGGLFVTAPLFSFFYLRFVGRRTWIFSIIYAVVIGVVLYAAFELALGVPTPTGLFLD